MVSSPSRARLAGELRQIPGLDVRFTRHLQMLYATDASNYQVEPIGVVTPRDAAATAALVAYCAKHALPLLPRGGGTSLAGQCVNDAIVLDYSPTQREVLKLDTYARTVHVQPGITVDELNRWLDERNTGLFFAPDPATSAQCAIGGCIGNNAAGSRSIRYGRTSENLAGLDVLLPTGERVWLGPAAGHKSPVAARLARQVADLVTRYAELIRARFPKTLRRNAGYALDLVLAQLDRGIAVDDLDLTGLLCGSEGTLAITLSALLKLHPVTRFKGLAIASFGSVDAAIDAVTRILPTRPTAIELMDDVVLSAAEGNAECRRYMELLPKVGGSYPKAVLYVEYQETDSIQQVEAGFDRLRAALPETPVTPYGDKSAMAQLWALRKAGEPLLHGLSGHRKPLTFIEDNAVPPENLSKFVRGVKEIVARHGTLAAYYAHASVGVLHIRPLLDLHDHEDRRAMVAIGTEVAELARQCGGVMSGEHGDGRVRGPLLERFFGPELMQAFRELKRIFDPAGILNPGMITDRGPVNSMVENLRIAPSGRDIQFPAVETYFDYSDQEGFAGAVEMCNGAGVCRKTAGGVMCPSYRATLDERHSTRGRGNALRLAISGQLPAVWTDPETVETLHLCLSCKACKSECPSNVDVARLKAEYTAQRYRHEGAPLSAKVFGHIGKLNRLASIAPNLANWIARLPVVRKLMNRLLNLAPQRTLPAFAPSLHGWFGGREVGSRQTSASSVEPYAIGREDQSKIQNPKSKISSPNPQSAIRNPQSASRVVLFADCFTTYNDPHVGQAAVKLLEAFGYTVELPRAGCCGRSMISTGLLDDAIRTADATLENLRPFIEDDSVKAIVVCEPSCLATIKDEWLSLKLRAPLDLRRKCAAKAMMVEQFIDQFWDQHPRRPEIAGGTSGIASVVLHGHCHQKALMGDQSSANLLRRLVGQRLKVLPSGCCGMAGSFGYTADRYEVSMKIGEQSLFSLLREEPEDAIVVAAGTSCRHQIKDGTPRTAKHPVELATELLA